MEFEEESIEDLKYLLGNMGIDILIAIDKGARDLETIKLFSGIPMSCIRGRIPVLLDLNLILKKNENFYLKEKGILLKKKLEKDLKR
jgi:predicted transcriptional regulator